MGVSASMRRVRTSVSVYPRNASATPLRAVVLHGAAVSQVDRFGRQKTIESELARTRGIRLSN